MAEDTVVPNLEDCDIPRAMSIYYHVGMVRFYFGCYDDALHCFQLALAATGWGKNSNGHKKLMARKDAHNLANILISLGECYVRKEEHVLALAAFEGAREAFERYGNFDGKMNPAHFVRLLNNIAHLHCVLGNVVEMINVGNEAAKLFLELRLTARSVAIFGEVFPIGIFPLNYAPAA